MFVGAGFERLDRLFQWLALSYSAAQQLYLSVVFVEVLLIDQEWSFGKKKKRQTGL